MSYGSKRGGRTVEATNSGSQRDTNSNTGRRPERHSSVGPSGSDPSPDPPGHPDLARACASQERLATRVSGHALGPRAALAARIFLRLIRHLTALRRVWLLSG